MSLEPTMTTLQLPLHSRHLQKGAKLGMFGNWEVPLYYQGILEEHQAVRTAAGLFDISHMGKFYFEGAGISGFLDSLLPRKIAAMPEGRALYMPLLNERGGYVDDIIVYRAGQERFYLIVNAGNMEKDWQWISDRIPSHLTAVNLTSERGLIAIQGPKSAELLDKVRPEEKFSSLRYYGFKEWKKGIAARTGYTGEDGFEIMGEVRDLESLWDDLLEAGKSQGVIPVGFGARDTLRLEAAMPLYGHDMNDDTTPFEAGLGWSVDMTKEQFTGKTALAEMLKTGPRQKLVGFEMIERGIPRQDYEVYENEAAVGKVTSGTFSPTLKKNIGLAYVAPHLSSPGSLIEILIRDKKVKALVVKLPFYKRR